MTCYGDRPKHCAWPSIRCEAVASPAKDTWQVWAKHSHRCVRKSEQMRAGRQVCWQHAAAEKVSFEPLEDAYSFIAGYFPAKIFRAEKAARRESRQRT